MRQHEWICYSIARNDGLKHVHIDLSQLNFIIGMHFKERGHAYHLIMSKLSMKLGSVGRSSVPSAPRVNVSEDAKRARLGLRKVNP